MKPKDMIFIVIALGLSLMLAIGLRTLFKVGGDEAKAEGGRIVVSAQSIPVGTRIQKEHIKWVEWPAASMSANYLTSDKGDKLKDLVGAIVRERVSEGEPLIKSELSFSKNGVLSAILEPGKRAFTIPTDRRASISTSLYPGDYVDVIVAVLDRKTRKYSAKTIVEAVRVLDVNGNLDPKKINTLKGKAATKNQQIAVEVDSKQAEKLAAGLKEGKPVISLISTSEAMAHGKKGENFNHASSEIKPGLTVQKKVEQEREKDKVITLIRGDETEEIRIEQ